MRASYTTSQSTPRFHSTTVRAGEPSDDAAEPLPTDAQRLKERQPQPQRDKSRHDQTKEPAKGSDLDPPSNDGLAEG
jgi:hypothetical protein